MLKSILISGTILLASCSYSQFEHGVKQIGFSTVFSGGSSKTPSFLGTTSNFRIAPSYNYFVKDNLSIGGTILFSASQSIQKINSTSNGNRSMSYGLGFNVNKYFKLRDNFYFTTNGMISFSNFSSHSISPAGNSVALKSNILGVSIVPSLLYLLTPKIGLTASFGNLYYTLSQPVGIVTNSNSYSNFGANFGLSSLSFGLVINLNSKKE